jgi:MazG family protein
MRPEDATMNDKDPPPAPQAAGSGALDDKSDALRRLEEIIERLRGPDGCPWDREQTLPSLARNFLEEACEAIDAITHESAEACPRSDAIREELGDLLMNVFLAARIAEESGGFDLAAVANGIADKLIRRHPHVFAGASASGVDEVLQRWQAIKAEEKAARGATPAPRSASVLDRVPASLPALDAADELGRQAAKLGFDWPRAEDALEKVREELREIEAALAAGGAASRQGLEHEIGDLLLAAANFSRKAGFSPDRCLRMANQRFRRRFRPVEDYIDAERARGRPAPPLAILEEKWQQAKLAEE